MILEEILYWINIIVRFITVFLCMKIFITTVYKSIKERKLKHFTCRNLMIISASNFFMCESMIKMSEELGQSMVEFKIGRIIMLVTFIIFGIAYMIEQKLGVDFLDLDSFLNKF